MFRRRSSSAGRPSLLRSAARGAVVGGAAQAAAGRVAQRQADAQQQAEQAAAPDQAAADTPASPPAVDTDSLIEQLKQLGELHKAGVLTDEEFAAQKSRLLT